MHENDIFYAIRGAAFKIYTALGPGLLESVYKTALAYELKKKDLMCLLNLLFLLYMRGWKWSKVFGETYWLITK